MDQCKKCGAVIMAPNKDHNCFQARVGESDIDRLTRHNEFLLDKLFSMHKASFNRWIQGGH